MSINELLANERHASTTWWKVNKSKSHHI